MNQILDSEAVAVAIRRTAEERAELMAAYPGRAQGYRSIDAEVLDASVVRVTTSDPTGFTDLLDLVVDDAAATLGVAVENVKHEGKGVELYAWTQA